jgi:hypothetical protein
MDTLTVEKMVNGRMEPAGRAAPDGGVIVMEQRAHGLLSAEGEKSIAEAPDSARLAPPTDDGPQSETEDEAADEKDKLLPLSEYRALFKDGWRPEPKLDARPEPLTLARAARLSVREIEVQMVVVEDVLDSLEALAPTEEFENWGDGKVEATLARTALQKMRGALDDVWHTLYGLLCDLHCGRSRYLSLDEETAEAVRALGYVNAVFYPGDVIAGLVAGITPATANAILRKVAEKRDAEFQATRLNSTAQKTAPDE